MFKCFHRWCTFGCLAHFVIISCDYFFFFVNKQIGLYVKNKYDYYAAAQTFT